MFLDLSLILTRRKETSIIIPSPWYVCVCARACQGQRSTLVPSVTHRLIHLRILTYVNFCVTGSTSVGVKRGLDPWSWSWAAQLSMWVLGRKPVSSGGAFSLASLHLSFWENASHWTGTHCQPAPKTELSWLPASSTRLKTHNTKLYKGATDWILFFMLVQK